MFHCYRQPDQGNPNVRLYIKKHGFVLSEKQDVNTALSYNMIYHNLPAVEGQSPIANPGAMVVLIS